MSGFYYFIFDSSFSFYHFIYFFFFDVDKEKEKQDIAQSAPKARMHQSQGPSSAEGVQWELLVRAALRTSPRVLPATMGSIDRIPLFTWFLGVELRFDRIRSAAGTCESCDGGFYSDVLEAGGCNRCNAGTYSQQNSSSCSLCLDVCPPPPIYHNFYFFLIIYLFFKCRERTH